MIELVHNGHLFCRPYHLTSYILGFNIQKIQRTTKLKEQTMTLKMQNYQIWYQIRN